MSITSTGLYGAATIVNTDLFDDVEQLKISVTNLTTSTSQNTYDITDLSGTKIPAIQSDIINIQEDITDLSGTKIPAIETDITNIQGDIIDISNTRIVNIETDISNIQLNKQDNTNDIDDTEILAIATYTQEGQAPLQITTTKGDFK